MGTNGSQPLDAQAIETMLLRGRQEWDVLVAVLEAHPERLSTGPAYMSPISAGLSAVTETLH